MALVRRTQTPNYDGCWKDRRSIEQILYNVNLVQRVKGFQFDEQKSDPLLWISLDTSYPQQSNSDPQCDGYLHEPKTSYEASCHVEIRHGPFRGYQLSRYSRIWGRDYALEQSASFYVYSLGGVLVPWLRPIRVDTVMLEFYVPFWFDGLVVRAPFVPSTPPRFPPLVLDYGTIPSPEGLSVGLDIVIGDSQIPSLRFENISYVLRGPLCDVDVSACNLPLMVLVVQSSTGLLSRAFWSYHYVRPPSFYLRTFNVYGDDLLIPVSLYWDYFALEESPLPFSYILSGIYNTTNDNIAVADLLIGGTSHVFKYCTDTIFGG